MGYPQVQWRNRRAKRLQRLRPGPFPWLWDELSLSNIKRQVLYRSQHLQSRRGGKAYKKRYHAEWRQQTRQLEHAAMIGDEVAFERFCPDGTRGAIAQDWW